MARKYCGLTYRDNGLQCGSIMFSEPKASPEILFLKIGLLDDKGFLDSLGTPKLDVYCKNLWAWEKPIEGAAVQQALG